LAASTTMFSTLTWDEMKNFDTGTVIAYSGGGARADFELSCVRRALTWPKTLGFIFDLPVGDGKSGPSPWDTLIPKKGWSVYRVLTNPADRGGSQRRWRLVLVGHRHAPEERTVVVTASADLHPVGVAPGSMKAALDQGDPAMCIGLESLPFPFHVRGPASPEPVDKVWCELRMLPNAQAPPGEPHRIGLLLVHGLQPGAIAISEGSQGKRGRSVVIHEVTDGFARLAWGEGAKPVGVQADQLTLGPGDLPIHDLSAPAPTVGGPRHPLLGMGGGLVLESSNTVRRLGGIELWRLQGGADDVWRRLAGEEMRQQNI
jgi:hypothetical protein